MANLHKIAHSDPQRIGASNPELMRTVRKVCLVVSLALGALFLAWSLWFWLVDGDFCAHPCQWLLDAFTFPEPTKDTFLAGPAGVLHAINASIWDLPQFLSVPLTGVLIAVGIFFIWYWAKLPILTLGRLVRNFKRALGIPEIGSRHLIFCFDGTWNHPAQKDEGVPAPTNVFEWWLKLKGRRSRLKEFFIGANRIKTSTQDKQRQIAFYYNGVGNPAENDKIGAAIGGGFGFGAKRLRRLAYRDLIRHYSKNDKITIVGFSRGAAIARWFASHINNYGVPKLAFCDTPVGRMLRKPNPARLAVPVNFLGVWDTVASFGMSKNLLGIKFQQVNLFKDFDVADNVERAVHLVSIDERRDAFIPTLMNPEPGDRIHEVWFAGIHCNVGGGYAYLRDGRPALDEKDEGHSAITFEYMLGQFRDWYGPDNVHLHDGPAGRNWRDALQDPLRSQDGALYEVVTRTIPEDAKIHWTAVERGLSPTLAYRPAALDDLAARLAARRHASEVRVAALAGPGGVADEVTAAIAGHARIEIDPYAADQPAANAPPAPPADPPPAG